MDRTLRKIQLYVNMAIKEKGGGMYIKWDYIKIYCVFLITQRHRYQLAVREASNLKSDFILREK